MKSYLQLVFKREKKNKFVLICIAISTFLIMALFSTTEMAIESQINLQKKTYGDYHIILRHINKNVSEQISKRKEIETSGWMLQGGSGSILNEVVTFLGADESIASMNTININSGRYPKKEYEIALNSTAMIELNKKVNDEISVTISDKEFVFRIVGVYEDTAEIQKAGIYGAIMSEAGFIELPFQDSDIDLGYRIKFKDDVNIKETMEEIKESFHLSNENISENTILLGVLGESSNKIMKQFYILSLILAAIVMLAGSFMIVSALNLEILENVSYYGMLRCIGSSKSQIKKLIFLEGLYKSIKSIPVGLILGQITSWIICLILKNINSNFFLEIPLFQINYRSLVISFVLGVVVVLISSFSPAKIASKVQPITAVKGEHKKNNLYKGSSIKKFKIETNLGIMNALKRKKNMLSLTASFSLCIMLIFCFQAILTFFNMAMPVLSPMTADVAIISSRENKITDEQIKKLKETQGISKVFYNKETNDFILDEEKVDLSILSVDDLQLSSLQKDVIKGSIDDIKREDTFILINDASYKYEVGDTVKLKTKTKEKEISIQTSINTFRRVGTDKDYRNYLICSESTYNSFFPNENYSYIGLTIDENMGSEIIQKITDIVPQDLKVTDFRIANSEQRDSYNTIAIFTYSFLGLIIVITFFNIFNTMNVSVFAKLKQIGVLKSIGMSQFQANKMIFTESIIYVCNGFIVGTLIGTFSHKLIYKWLVVGKWGTPWSIPYSLILIDLLICILATILSLFYPINKIKKTSIIDLMYKD